MEVTCRVWTRTHNITHHMALTIVNVGKRLGFEVCQEHLFERQRQGLVLHDLI